MVSTIMQIIFINNLYKKLNLTYNLNISGLKTYMQKFLSILQDIMLLIKVLQQNFLPIAQNNCLSI